MKLQDFVPDIASQNQQLVKANTTLQSFYQNGFFNFIQKAYGVGGKDGSSEVRSKVDYYGIEQLYFDWLRTAYAYRRMFIQDLYLLAFDIAEIRTPLLHLKGEIFRKGFDEWKPKFVVKCTNCGTEYQQKEEKCKICGNDKLRKPDKDQYKYFNSFRKNCNIFGQSLEEIMQTLEDDINIVDDSFLHLHKQYALKNNELWGRVVEIRRIHPALMEYDLDKNGIPRNSHWICPFHRDEADVKPGKCKYCGIDMLPVMYIYNHRGRRIYLYEEEVIHSSKFSNSETYGYSPLLTIMQKILTISGMDRFLYRYFFERKAPTGMILTYTDDPQSLEVERARIESKMMEDPTYMPWVAVSQRTGRGRTDFVRLFHTLHEMDYLNVRNEIRDRVSAMYGVPQLYLNVLEGIGGLSGQTQQLKVFSNVIEADQRRYNEKVFPRLLKAFNITDWEIRLRAPEEKVESVILQQAQQKVAVATQMMSMGFQVNLKPGAETIDKLDFVFTGQSQNPQEMMAQMAAAQGDGEQLPPGQQSEEGEGAKEPSTPENKMEMAQDIAHRDFNKRNPLEESAFEDIEANKIIEGTNI